MNKVYIPEYHGNVEILLKSESVFTWLDEIDRYIIEELWIADAMRKRPLIFIAGPERFDDYIYDIADFVLINPKLSPDEACEVFLECKAKLKKAQSPIEVMFMKSALLVIDELDPQVKVGPYRVDLAIEYKKIAIELDGHDYHKTKEQRTHDAKRQRYLELNGWRVIRFTGTEIYNSVERCVNETLVLINQWSNK